MDLDTLRQKIDGLDDALLVLLNQRAQLVREVADLKEQLQIPFYVPSRERTIIDRLIAANPGPFPSEAIRPVFQEVFSACLSLQRVLRVAYLGPEATFTHMAVKQQFGVSTRSVPVGTISAVFEEVERGRVEFGVVPVENSTEGVVNHTLDSFLDTELKICAEIILQVSHCLLVRPGVEIGDVERVYSHPQALAQCRHWLGANLPQASAVEAPFTAGAARTARDDARGAAIGSEMAARHYELAVARRKIEDSEQNVTRFLVLGKDQAAPTGKDKTSVLLGIKDEAGALYRVLQAFSDRGINLSKIESRPSRKKAWEYVFFVDLDGHVVDASVAEAIGQAKAATAAIKILGSYPKAQVI